jgi:hypothetical protein
VGRVTLAMAEVEVEPKRISLLDVIHKSKKEIVTRITIVAAVTEALTATKATKLAGVHFPPQQASIQSLQN